MHKGSSILSKFGGKSKSGGAAKKTWIHAPITLTQHFAVYQAKLLGVLNVQQAKGVEVVKDAIKKLKLAHEINKSEAGNKGSKLPKVEVWISVDLVKVTHAKTKVLLHQKQLHKISYCADDHFETKLFSFIAKDDMTGGHECFVFITEREASELTLTVGQAFELAYQRYLQKRGAADLMRSREAEEQKSAPESNGVTTTIPTEVQRDKPAEIVPSDQAPPKEDFLVDFGSGEPENTLSSTRDPFEQYLASVASRGVATNDQPVSEPFDMSGLTPAHVSTNSSNPFQSEFDVSGNTLSASPHLPRPKPTGSTVASTSFPHALPKPPSKKDIKNSPVGRPRPANGSPMQPTNNKAPDNVSTNPFKPDSSQPLDMMTALENDFSQGMAMNNSNTFDPFG